MVMEVKTNPFDDLKRRVQSEGGVLTLPAWEIRDMYGAGRLGAIVRENISRELRRQGLGHYPAEIPGDQYKHIRIYEQGSRVEDLIEAVLDPNEDGDRILRDAVGGAEAERALLDQIRSLLE
jgi:hypothetical protein